MILLIWLELQKMFKDQLSPDQIDNLAERFSDKNLLSKTEEKRKRTCERIC